jgi:hypothetical protein
MHVKMMVVFYVSRLKTSKTVRLVVGFWSSSFAAASKTLGGSFIIERFLLPLLSLSLNRTVQCTS